MKLRNKYNKDVQEWIAKARKAYLILKRIPLKDLQVLGDQGGLDMNHYKTKMMISKGLMIRLGSCLPVEFDKWR